MVLIIIIAVLLMFICGQIYLKKLRIETEKNVSEISTAENENFEVEQIVKTYRNEAQYQKKRSRLYLQMIFFAGVLMILGFGWYLYQEYKEALSLGKMSAAVPEWQSVKDDFPNLFVPSAEVQEHLFAKYQAEQITKLEKEIEVYHRAYKQQNDLPTQVLISWQKKVSQLEEWQKMTATEYWNSNEKSKGYIGIWFFVVLFLGFLLVYIRLKPAFFKLVFGCWSFGIFTILPYFLDFYTLSELILWICCGGIWLFFIVFFGQKKYRTE